MQLSKAARSRHSKVAFRVRLVHRATALRPFLVLIRSFLEAARRYKPAIRLIPAVSPREQGDLHILGEHPIQAKEVRRLV